LYGKHRKVQELEELYVPFWTFDGFVHRLTWRRPRTVPPGKPVIDQGALAIHDLLLAAVATPPPNLLERVLPFDLHEVVAYEPLRVADKAVALHTLDVEAVARRAHRLMLERARAKMGWPAYIESLAGEQEAQEVRETYQVSGIGYRLLLLPVWLGQMQSERGAYVCVVNAQSGSVVFGPVQSP
jgi:hypothetical protein